MRYRTHSVETAIMSMLAASKRLVMSAFGYGEAKAIDNLFSMGRYARARVIADTRMKARRA